jgi:hypothetical protein
MSQQPQDAVNVREVGAVLFQLAFELLDQPGDECALLA